MIITVGSQVFDGQKQSYTLIKLLGRGGFGSVYKACRDIDHCTVAVKSFSSDFASKESMLSFQKELQQSILVKSEHVVDYIYAHDGNTYTELPPYIIMEFADGGSLASMLLTRRLIHKKFSSKEIVDMFRQLCTGMKAVNQLLVHRDIKPDNILVCNGKLKIGDFGLSKIASDTTKTHTFKGYGTARYIAPEAWDNDHATIQMDIYSMGIVFYEIATLEYPYSIPNNADYSAYRNAHCYQALNTNPFKESDLGGGIISTIIKMLEKPTQARYSDWDSILKAITDGSSGFPENAISLAVERALSERNEYDIAQQAAKLSAQQANEEKNNNNKLICSQVNNTILSPVREFISQYNSRYQGKAKFKLNDASGIVQNKTFVISIDTPNGDRITIETEVIYPENHTETVKDTFGGVYSKQYIPQCNNRHILAWSRISDRLGIGFNLLLLRNQDSMYGDWYILHNTNNGLGNSTRVEPFGFSIEELPSEIKLINSMHIYYSKVMPFTCDYIIDYLTKHISS